MNEQGTPSAGCVPMTAEQERILRDVAPRCGGLEGALLRMCVANLDAQAARLEAYRAFLVAVQAHGWDAACEVLGDPFAEEA